MFRGLTFAGLLIPTAFNRPVSTVASLRNSTNFNLFGLGLFCFSAFGAKPLTHFVYDGNISFNSFFIASIFC